MNHPHLDTSKKYLVITLGFFGVLYAMISLVNHYTFRTSALDLGLYTNALYDYLHFQWNDSLTFKKIPENLLADHFDLYLMIFSPLSLLFGTYTLLIIQIAAILFGGLGVYNFFKGSSPNLALPAMVFFLSFFAVYSALAFDYHSNVVAAMLVPWFLLRFKEAKYAQASFFFLLVLIAKENMALWMAFICIGLIFDYYKNNKSLKILVGFIVISIAYYFLIIHAVMPAFSNSGSYPHFHFSAIGSNTIEAVGYIFRHPVESAKMLFVNHTADPIGDYVKLELHISLLLSGGLLLFLKPNYLLMLLPIFFQKLFHDYVSMWSIGDHYSIEFAPVMAIGSFLVIAKIKQKKYQRFITYGLIILTVATTIRVMDNTVVYTNKASIRFYHSTHYQKEYDLNFVHEKLNTIPENAVVSVQTNFLPHLALRDYIYQFPTIRDAEYIILAPAERSYPLKQEDYDQKVQEIRNSTDWELMLDTISIVIFKRRASIQQITQ